MNDFYKKNVYVTFPNKEVWAIPLKEIADSKASYYAKIDGVSQEEALKEVLELFESDSYEIKDWALNNMDWEDFDNPVLIDYHDKPYNYNEAWLEIENMEVR